MQETPSNREEPYEPAGECAHLSGSELGLLITRSGSTQIRRFCRDCERPETFSIPRKALEMDGVDVGALPVMLDHREDKWANPPCERCGSHLGTEYHHWAPKHLFGAVEHHYWPGSYLCRACHDRWHNVVTPKMSRKAS